MPFIPVPNVAMAELRFQLTNGQRAENTLYFSLGASPDELDLQGLGSELAAWWGVNCTNFVPQSVTLREVYLTSLVSATAPAVTWTGGLPTGGNVPSPALPSNVTVAVSFRTSQRGRSARGRNYWPGLSESQVSGDTVDAVTIQGIIDAYTDLILDPPSGWVWGIVSRYTNHAPRVEGVFLPVTTVVFADTAVDSMRTRLLGRGN